MLDDPNPFHAGERRAQARAAASPAIPPPLTVIFCPLSTSIPPSHKTGHRVRCPIPCATPKRAVVAGDFFAAFVTLLRFQAHRGDGPCVKAFETDRFTRHFTVAVFAFVNAA